MRLKTFTAPNMAEAMKLVKEHLGDDAIIVSEEKDPSTNGVRLTAAMEMVEEDDWDSFDEDGGDILDEITDALTHHNVPGELSDKLSRMSGTLEADDALMALSGALDQVFKFQPIATSAKRPIMLVGMPGAGKTVTIAKLAARAVMAKKRVSVITTDAMRAGGYEQLEAFTKVMRCELLRAETPGELQDALLAGQGADLTLIDCAGSNPFDPADLKEQKRLIDAAEADVVAVMAGGGDPLDAIDMARAYRKIGARRLLITRLDIARRLGSILAAADSAKLIFANAGTGANVAKDLTPLNAVSLARFLLPHERGYREEAAE